MAPARHFQPMEAIQVLECVDDRIQNGRNFDEVKKIKTVYHYRNGPTLQDVLLQDDFKDLPILVFSIAGKTREGKSFLLNLMIQHLRSLENKGTGDWQRGRVPNCFTWGNGITSITRGLWIYPKIFRLKDCYDNEVGVMLLDMEGMYDGEATDGEIIAISGISAAISHLQMFNMKEKITCDYLESVIRNLIKGIEELNSEEKRELKEDYKLMFVVRDWIGEETYRFGLSGGEDYIENERRRGTKENQQLWEMIHNTFGDIKCVLLPDPGRQVTRRQFNQSGDLTLLDGEFLYEVKLFVEHLFKPENLNPTSTRLTCRDIYNILTSIDGKIADEELSFLNIFTEHANLTKVEKWKSSFQETLEDVRLSGLQEAKSEMFNIIRKAERTLIGKSQTMYLTELTEALEGAFNRKVIDICFQRYENSFVEYASVEKQQSGIWPDVKRMLHKHLCGNNSTRQNAYLIFIKKCVVQYYCLLHQDHKRRFQSKCSTKKTLEECSGLDEKEIKSFKECEDFTNDFDNKEIVYPLWLKEYQSLKNEITNILLQHISNITGINLDDLKKLRRKQYEHFECFTLLNKDEFNLDCVPRKDKQVIAKKVGYGMFGPPSQLSIALSQRTQMPPFTLASLTAGAAVGPSATLATIAFSAMTTYFRGSGVEENPNTGYSKDQESVIWPVVEKLISLSTTDMVKFSCVFVVYYQNNEIVNVPIFRVESRSGVIYIDSNCRQYTDWNNFLTSNTLPDVVYCFPFKGRYLKTEGFGVAFSSTPASETTAKVLKTGDIVGKGVITISGIAGCAVLCGVAAPIVGGIAIVGGVVGGVYGAARGVEKIRDKKEHGEPIQVKDVVNVAANGLAVVGAVGMAVGRTFAVAAEGAAFFFGTRAAAGFSGLSSLTILFSGTNDTPELISLIAEVEDSSLKILFYFGTTCSNNALNVIRKSLKLEDNKNTVETLLALLENNCIQFAAETGTGGVRIEKYVSQNTATLVTSILTAVSSDVREIVLYYCEAHSVFQCIGETRNNIVADKLQKIMRKLLRKHEHEISLSKARFTTVLCHNIDILSDGSTFIQDILDKLGREENNHLILAFRHLIWSLISKLRRANRFFNNIDHEAITLRDHYLNDVSCHPLREISQLVKEMVEQSESAVEFNTTDINELNYFVLEVLKLLKQNSNENWSVYQFARCLNNITEDMASGFEDIVSLHKEIVNGKKKVSCNDLDLLAQEIGMEGYNYGTWVSKKVLNKLNVDVDAVENMALGRPSAQNSLIMSAWSGILDHLYYYCSDRPVSEKLYLIKQIENIQEENYKRFNLQDYNLSIFTPCDEDADMSSFVVYSELNRGPGLEQGFIWLYKKDKQRPEENNDPEESNEPKGNV